MAVFWIAVSGFLFWRAWVSCHSTVRVTDEEGTVVEEHAAPRWMWGLTALYAAGGGMALAQGVDLY